jgi:3-isopropylmalate/(R)-2-methylmalate dehydratase small subunit
MEVAVTVIQSAGIRAVVAQSFARSFFRNAINNGLMVVECDTASITEGNRLELEIDGPSVTVRVPARHLAFTGAPIPPLMQGSPLRGPRWVPARRWSFQLGG